MCTRAIVFVAALLGLSMPAQASEDWTLGAHVASVHVPALKNQNNFNPGAYVVAPNGVTVGAYHNTMRKTSVYVGYLAHFKYADVLVGGVTGYKKELGRAVMPLVAVSHAFDEVLGWHPRVTYIPKATPKATHLLHLSLEINF